MHVIVKNQRKNFSSEVHDIFTKETEQGYISMFLVNDHEGRFHWVDFEQCILSLKLENEYVREEYCDQCYSCHRRIEGCNLIYGCTGKCDKYINSHSNNWVQV